MASPSSSMSQESLDHEEGDDGFANRTKSKNIRLLRARGALRTDRDNGDSYDTRDSTVQNGDTGEGEGCGGGSSAVGDHESTGRSLASRDRPKDKRTRPNHLQRGKLPKDKRKLREKRRSTGVVHLQSTESTGDSLDDEDTDKDRPVMETSRNTKYNEIIDADNPQTPAESHGRKSFAARRNKSPSDLEADLEDNQDYDSTVSQSECNLVLIDQKDPVSYPKRTPVPVSQHTTRAPGYSKIGYGVAATSVRGESQVKTSYVASVLSTYPTSETNRPRHSSVLSRYQPDRKPETSFKSDFGHRFRDRDISSTGTSVTRVQLPKENLNNSKGSSSYSSRQAESQSSQLEILKEENRRLEKLLEEKNRRIGELEEKISALNEMIH
ncbi:uncharacterized protein LOC135470520 isoform X2 [Liolophura sinensis]|uniref:uncharacterized protein LOC135470520 isoform X2 n=1 Tax=Liolophura sinensis TaxID=3198878 RepID=UPI003158A209